MHPRGTPDTVSVHHVTQQHFVTVTKTVALGVWTPLLHALQDWRSLQAARMIAEHRHLLQDENCVEALRGSTAARPRPAVLDE
jgi:hypothetical protein